MSLSQSDIKHAMKMYQIGYNYAIAFSDNGKLKGRILYTKTVQQAIELMRTTFKDESGYSILRLTIKAIYNVP